MDIRPKDTISPKGNDNNRVNIKIPMVFIIPPASWERIVIMSISFYTDKIAYPVFLGKLGYGTVLRELLYIFVYLIAKSGIAELETYTVLLGIKALIKDHISIASG